MGKFSFCFSSSQGSKVSYRAAPSSRRPAQWHLSSATSRCYADVTAVKIPQIPETFTPVVINMVTNESNLWSQSVTNIINLLRGQKLISIHLGHSSVEEDVVGWLTFWEFSHSCSKCLPQNAQRAKLRYLNTDNNLKGRQLTLVINCMRHIITYIPSSPPSYLLLYAQCFALVMWFVFKTCLHVHAFLFPFLARCKWVWSVPAGPRREAVCPRVCECPRLVPLLLPQRLQVATRWAKLWGWVTRGNRGQRLIHRALGCGSGRVCSSREEYLWFRETREPLAAELLVPAEVSVRPLSFALLKLTLLASGMNDLTLSQ